MNWDMVIAISEVIGTIGVVLSVIYLALQIKRSNILSQGQTRGFIANSAQQELLPVINNPNIFEIPGKEEVSRDEKIVIHHYLISSMIQREYEWHQYQNGILDKRTFLTRNEAIKGTLGTKRTRDWWEANKIICSPEFSQHVDSLIAGEPMSELRNFDRW
jgi:hypothetical protein